LFVGDAICSVSIIDVVEAEAGEMRLESVAKDFGPLWPVTVESLDQDTIIGANVSRSPISDYKSTQIGFSGI
jgi:DNA damage-binding protein 1